MNTQYYEDNILRKQKSLIDVIESIINGKKRDIQTKIYDLESRTNIINILKEYLSTMDIEVLLSLDLELLYERELPSSFFKKLDILKALKVDPSIPQYKIAFAEINKIVDDILSNENELSGEKSELESELKRLNEDLLKVNGSFNFSIQEIDDYLQNYRTVCNNDKLLLMSLACQKQTEFYSRRKQETINLQAEENKVKVLEYEEQLKPTIQASEELLKSYQPFIDGFNASTIEIARQYNDLVKSGGDIDFDVFSGSVKETKVLCALLNLESSLKDIKDVEFFTPDEKIYFYETDGKILTDCFQLSTKLIAELNEEQKKIETGLLNSNQQNHLAFLLNEEEYPEFLKRIDGTNKKMILSGLEELSQGNFGNSKKNKVVGSINTMLFKRKSNVGISYMFLANNVILIVNASNLEDLYDESIYIESKSLAQIEALSILAKNNIEELINMELPVIASVESALQSKKEEL